MSLVSSPTIVERASGPQPRDIAVPGRLTNRLVVVTGSILLLFPNLLFALHLTLLPAALMLLGAVASILVMCGGSQVPANGALAQPIVVPRLVLCFALAVLLFVFGGEGHLMFANRDWLWRDAVLADLSQASFPPTYVAAGQSFFLRAPLGMYMLPALVAKASSLGWGHTTLLLQNATLLALVLYMLATIAGRRAWLVVLVFLSFSGLDILGQLLMWLARTHALTPFVLPSHIESWTWLQYSSVITQLFWVPNHALPAYWLAILVLLCVRREVTVSQIAVVTAASLFWSPFAFIGTLPFAAYLFLRDMRCTVARTEFWLACVAAAGVAPIAAFFAIDAARVPHEFVLLDPAVACTIALFLMIEIPHAAFIRAGWRAFDSASKGILAVALVFLAVLPTVYVGAAGDLVMRASIPALMILAVFFANVLGDAWEANRLWIVGAGVAVILIGAVTPAQEIVRASTFPAFAISHCTIVAVWEKLSARSAIENYLARSAFYPGWLIRKPEDSAPLTNGGRAVCWPDIPFSPRSSITSMSNEMLRHTHDGGKEPPL